jgi:hypothetical protein
MHRKILIAACALLCATPALAADKRIYKIDSLIATQKKGRITVQANGAVQSGGWKNARLHIIPRDNNRTLTVEFVATPPPPGMVVIDGLLPVTVSAEFKAIAGTTAVKLVADANEMTAQILK